MTVAMPSFTKANMTGGLGLDMSTKVRAESAIYDNRLAKLRNRHGVQ